MRPRWLVASALLLMLVAPPGAQAQSSALRVELSPESVQATTSGSNSTTVTVTNEGLSPLAVRLAAQNATGGLTVDITPSDITVLPGRSETAHAVVRGATPGDWSVRIVATSGATLGQPSENASALLLVRIVAPPANGTSAPETAPASQPPAGSGPPPPSSTNSSSPPPANANATEEKAPAQDTAGAQTEPEEEPAQAPTEPPAERGLVVRETSIELAVEPGSSASFSLGLENPDARAHEARVTLRLPIGWGGRLDDTLILVPAGGTGAASGEVTAARAATDAEGTLEIDDGVARRVVTLRLRILAPQVEAPTGAAGDEPVELARAPDAPPSETPPAPVAPVLRLVPSEIHAPPGAHVVVTLYVANPGDAPLAGRASLAIAPFAVATDDADFYALPHGETFVTFTIDVPRDAAYGSEHAGAATIAPTQAAPATLRLVVAGAASTTDAAAAATRGDARILLAASLAGIGAITLAGAAAWRRWPGLGLFALYARLAPRRALEHPRRAAMLAALRAEPGLPLAELQRRLELSNGVARHHLALLEAAGVVRSVQDGTLRRLWPVEAPRVEATPTLRERALALLAARGPLRAAELAAELGVSRQALHYHVKRLEQEGRVVATRVGGEVTLHASASSGSAR